VAFYPSGDTPDASSERKRPRRSTASSNGDRGESRRARHSLPLIPLREAVLFPQALAPLSVGRESSLNALEEATKRGRHILVAAQRDPAQDHVGEADIYGWGTVGEI
jgi:ATP-dependent Lon protease